MNVLAKSLEGKKNIILFVFCIITFFVNNGVIKPDIMESRNIITAREMVYDGHWMVPTMNGELRLEKPPLPTWLTAVAEMVVPDSVQLQRAMAGLAALMLVFFFYRFAKRILHIDPMISTLLLCTCYNVILMGRTASWDIYCHAFMMGAIYHLALALKATGAGWRNFILAGLLAGLSIMSKGPVSVYALLLPFIIAFGLVCRPQMRGKWPAVAVMALIAMAVGTWWYAYIWLFEGDALRYVVNKESGAWVNRNVRPWYYYWKFFLESGVWSVALLTAIFLPLSQRAARRVREYAMPLAWMLIMLVMLSLLPEKKARYLLPILIPACLTMGYMFTRWAEGFATKADKTAFRINAWLIAAIVAVLPAAAYLFVYRPGHVNITLLVIFSAVFFAIALWMARAAISLNVRQLVAGVAVLFAFAECAALPYLDSIINNPDMRSLSLTRSMKTLDGIPFYYNVKDDLRIELVYAAHRKIKPLDVRDTALVMSKLPCAILTHKRVGEELPQALLDRIDTTYIGLFDDNRRPKGNRRYRDIFIYNVTLLKAK